MKRKLVCPPESARSRFFHERSLACTRGWGNYFSLLFAMFRLKTGLRLSFPFDWVVRGGENEDFLLVKPRVSPVGLDLVGNESVTFRGLG
ncbi:hypothetical protein GJ744_004395 [Endocarpon pusillum]|uniref:Uncharacterized protein n=1 Tax=Endocarpon pusillum TaxID=364733 RepID=A0A8H7AZN4_9EURO|nr:hypothetical protein GJ744_004395 [Endocarpon pusillum]